eukprot:2152228-Amphidinium_carterae.1
MQNQVVHHMQGGGWTWTQEMQRRRKQTQCPVCECLMADWKHILWDCRQSAGHCPHQNAIPDALLP